MNDQKYTVNQLMVSNLLSLIQTKAIAIPEIQRPFVWNASKVRDLIDSLYQGFPIGYIVIWQNPDIRLKDNSISLGKKILIDGQQRITALTAAILGERVKNDDYEEVRIRIAYNPVENKFEVCNSAIEKDVAWIQDIAPLLSGEVRASSVRKEYCKLNPNANEDAIDDIIEALRDITKKQIGIIELSGDLDIDKVTEIFIRINSQGVPLSQADFVMSKIAANEIYAGNLLRKCIDHFSHLAAKPEFFSKLKENDKEFVKSSYFDKIAWLRNENDDLYDPSYVDVLRVAFTCKFIRGKMGDLVSLLSGRNFQTREYEIEIEENTYKRLAEGVCDFINETNFKRYIMIIRSAGFCHSKLIRSQNVLNFGYVLYLKLKEKACKPELIEHYVRRWIVFSILTGRYSGSPESRFDYDIKQVDTREFSDFLYDVETAQLSEAFWNAELIQRLNTAIASSPLFNVFLASQCFQNRKGFLSLAITVKDMIEQKGDVHHIFPRMYLKDNGLPQSQYNQIANYAYTQTEINIQIGKKSPKDYLGYIVDTQCKQGNTKFGGITDLDKLKKNLVEDNCIPFEVAGMGMDNFQDFLTLRRKLIAQRLKEYYFSL